MIAPMNFMVKAYLKKWDSELHEIAVDCGAVQKRQLERILHSDHVIYLNKDVQSVSYTQFKKCYPLTTYDDYREGVLELKEDSSLKCKYYAQSAGTTSGIKKLIPTTDAFVKLNHLRASWYLLHTLYQHDDEMSIFKAKNLLVGGSIYEENKDHTIGDISGIMLNRIPLFFRPWYVPSTKVAVSPDWYNKISKTVDAAANENKITMIGGTPTWVLSILRNVLKQSGQKKLSTLWPGLKAYIHGGVDFSPYKHQMTQLIGLDHPMRYIEVYNASEGFFAYQDRPEEEGMLLICASGIFYEFIKYKEYMNGNRDAVAIQDVALDQDYVMIISTISGLLRYVQGDVIRFVTLAPYRIKVTGRINSFINAFGEDLLLQHVESALKEVNEKHQSSIRHFTVAPFYLTISEKGRHDWFIEWESAPVDMEAFAHDLDHAVRKVNTNYDQKRTEDLALNELRLYTLKSGLVNQYFEKHSRIGGQSKLQKLTNNRKIADRILTLMNES